MSATLIADLKRQLAAERDHGQRLQKQLDAILRTDKPSPSEADCGARRDTARLDWLEQQSAHGLIIDIVSDWTYNGRRYGAGMRDAIDAAMSASGETEDGEGFDDSPTREERE